MQELDRHVEREEHVDRSSTGFYFGNRRLQVETQPLIVVEESERNRTRTTCISRIVAKAIEHEMGILAFVLGAANGGQ
jgi:hypothetical protein